MSTELLNNAVMKNVTVALLMMFTLQVTHGQMQQALDKIRNDYNLMGLSVVTVCDGRINGSYHAGLRDFDRDLPVNDSSMFRIASISKLVMTTAMMKLYDKKLFRLDDDISNYLGFKLRNPNYPDNPITIRMLLSHTSSINEGNGYDGFLSATYNNVSDPPGFAQLLVPGGKYYTDDMWRKEPPGTYFSYCNANFGLAGTIIERISGMRFDRYMEETLFVPLGITGAYTVEGLTDINNLGAIYRNENGQWVPQTDDLKGRLTSPRDFSGYKAGINAAIFSPQGGLRISAAELARVMILHIDKGKYNGKRIISGRSIRLMQTPQWTYNGSNGETDDGRKVSWGLSIAVLGSTPSSDLIPQGVVLYGHGGDAYGLISKFYYDRKSRSGLIIMTNGIFNKLTRGSYPAFNDFEEAVFSAARKYAGLFEE
jgi:CubicO group peptidase (beta-lactamase class C family)